MLPPSGVKTLLGIPLLDILMYKRDHPYYRLMGSDLGLAPIEVCPDHLLYRRATMATSLSKRKVFALRTLRMDDNITSA